MSVRVVLLVFLALAAAAIVLAGALFGAPAAAMAALCVGVGGAFGGLSVAFGVWTRRSADKAGRPP